MNSKNLNAIQIRGLNKLGDLMLPGFSNSEQSLPSFSKLGAVKHVDRILDFMPKTDLQDLKLLLQLFGFLPAPFVAFVLYFLELVYDLPFCPGIFRFMRIGIRGLIMTLYYGDTAIHEKIQYKINVVPL